MLGLVADATTSRIRYPNDYTTTRRTFRGSTTDYFSDFASHRSDGAMDSKSQRKILHQIVSTVFALVAARLAVWVVDKLMGEEA